ncbi:MAG: hypothetical protein LBW85_01485 [Deltaproteobacteria bacterium]|jgi:hypothetical protein|nr:hypothetical protein [Deltaproteobacteria bacterium]
MSGPARLPVPALVAAAALAALAAAVWLAQSGGGGEDGSPPPEPARSPVVRDAGYGAYSSSALGTEALFEVLKEHRPFVERRLAGSPLPLGPMSAVVIADSASVAFSGEGEPFEELQGSEGRILLILPKWIGDRRITRRSWLSEVYPGNGYQAERVLEALGEALEGAAQGEEIETVSLDFPPSFNYNETGVDPDFAGRRVQLLPHSGIEPVVSSREGVLFGRLKVPGKPRIWVLSDPDLTSNHGIVRGGNLRFAMRVFDLWTADLPRSAAVTFDESHLALDGAGQEGGEGVFGELMSLSGAAPALLAYLVAMLLLLYSARRRWPERSAAPAAFGKAGLIANTARLLERGPLRADLFLKYMDDAVGAAARALKAPPAARADRKALIRWLDARAPRKGPWRLEKLALEAERELASPAPSASRLLFLAGRLHLWKEEAEIGPGTFGKDSPRRPR